ncbi:hypothetical protein Kisp02_41060 [Kineosporia sp. NBRC 101731]|nr:hypothetical protein Kisp02_41060 [Kineosporia sp. NBRC 101731]
MKAIQMSTPGSPDLLRLVDLPDPVPEPGQALVRVQAAAVNFMDLLRVKGLPFDIPTPLPFTPGAEVAGTVVALGPGVENVKVGDRVFGLTGQLADGGWAELALAGAQGLMPVPEGVSLDQATGLTVVGAGAAVLLIAAAAVKPGETVFVPAAAGGFRQLRRADRQGAGRHRDRRREHTGEAEDRSGARRRPHRGLPGRRLGHPGDGPDRRPGCRRGPGGDGPGTRR